MAEFMDPYAGSQQHTDDSKRRALDAVAQAGTAGLKAFKEAQEGINSSQHAALERARQSAQMFGTDPSAFGSGRVQTEFGRQLGNVQGSQADFSAHNQAMGAANTSYFEKVQAALGALKGQNEAKISEYDAGIKAYQARLEAEAQAAAAAQAAKEAAENERLRFKESQENARADARNRADAAKEQKSRVNKITLNELIGLANEEPGILRDTGNILGQAKGGEKIRAAELAKRGTQIGRGLGMDDTTLAGMQHPNFLADLAKNLTEPAAAKQVPPGPDMGWLTGPDPRAHFRYEGKQISSKRAEEVLRAPEVPMANQFVGTLVNTRVVNGRIDDSSAGEYQGLTPEQAFNRYLDSLPGIRTMKTALRDYYLPWIKTNVV